MSVAISVIVPTYKRPELLARCLSSIYRQTYTDFEVLVVDNARDSQEARGVVEKINDPRFIYMNELTPGVSAARNRGLQQAQGELVLFVDDDDEIVPEMLQKLLDFMRQSDQSDISFTWCGVIKLFEESGRIKQEKRFLVTDQDIQDMTFLVKIGTGCGLCVRKDALLEVGGFDEDYKLSEDRDLLIKLIKAGKHYRPLNEFLYKRYYHCGERLSQSLHSLEEAEHDYKLYYEHLHFILQYPELRLRLLDLRARHYFEGGEQEKAIDVAHHAWQIQPLRIRSFRRMASYWLRSLFTRTSLSKSGLV
ncbi:MAG TPA: glycosyltransferase family A protein [Gammaproteobacteria bacterium]